MQCNVRKKNQTSRYIYSVKIELISCSPHLISRKTFYLLLIWLRATAHRGRWRLTYERVRFIVNVRGRMILRIIILSNVLCSYFTKNKRKNTYIYCFKFFLKILLLWRRSKGTIAKFNCFHSVKNISFFP